MARPQGESDPLLGAQLRIARTHRNLSQSALQRLASVSRKHISDAEKGKNISVAVLARLMHALGLKQVNFGSDLAANRAGSDATILLAIAEQIEAVAEQNYAALSRIVTLIREQTRKADAAEIQLRERAAALSQHFTKRLREAKADDLALLESAIMGTPREDSPSKVSTARKKRVR